MTSRRGINRYNLSQLPRLPDGTVDPFAEYLNGWGLPVRRSYTANEAARILECSHGRVLDMMRKGELEFIVISEAAQNFRRPTYESLRDKFSEFNETLRME